MINGAHAIIYTPAAEEVRAFMRDVLGFRSVDAGDGWLIFALPPAEMGIHPAKGKGSHEIFLLCDDLERTMEELRIRGAHFSGPIGEQPWGRTTSIDLPGGGTLGLYQPLHPTAHS